jgi:hypothetical protein
MAFQLLQILNRESLVWRFVRALRPHISHLPASGGPVCVVKTQLMFKIDGLDSRPVVAEGTVAAC